MKKYELTSRGKLWLGFALAQISIVLLVVLLNNPVFDFWALINACLGVITVAVIWVSEGTEDACETESVSEAFWAMFFISLMYVLVTLKALAKVIVPTLKSLVKERE
jgi:hypothetical protein